MKSKDYKYDRLSEEDACRALAFGIIRLEPKASVYRAANYILTYKSEQLGYCRRVLMVLEDKKKTFKCTFTFEDEGFQFSSSVVVETPGDDDTEPKYFKSKSGLRQMLAAIVLFDYATSKEPEAFSF